MAYQLNFSQKQRYDSLETGISLEVALQYGGNKTHCRAKIDTGSQACLFERGIGEFLGIPIESGLRREFSTLTGRLTAFGHEVVLESLGLQLQSFVYFAESDAIKRNLLGRQGWLQLLKFGLVDYDSEIYLSLYDEK